MNQFFSAITSVTLSLFFIKGIASGMLSILCISNDSCNMKVGTQNVV